MAWRMTQRVVSPLMRACRAKRQEDVVQLLSDGADPNENDSRGRTAFQCLFRDDDYKYDTDDMESTVSIGKVLLDHGADPNAADNDGITVLMMTCAVRSVELVNELLARGADPKRKDKDGGVSALHYLCNWCDTLPDSVEKETTYISAIGKALLTHGADPDSASEMGITPLMMACNEALHDLMVELLSSGADPHKKDLGDRTPLYLLCISESSNDGLIAAIGSELLRQGADPNVSDLQGVTPLMRACRCTHHDLVVQLLSHGADPNRKDEDDAHTALLYLHLSDPAKESQIASMGSALLKHGADPNISDQEDVTLLMRACKKTNHDLVVELLSHGADPNKKDEEDAHTALHYLCKSDSNNESLIASMGSALLRHGADPNASDLNGITPLMSACMNVQYGLAVELLSNGADPNKRDVCDNTALHYLRLRADGDSPIVSTCSALLEHGADPNATTSIRRVTPLMEACGRAYHDLVAELLSNGADPSRRDDDNRTALHYLCTDHEDRGEDSLIASTGSALLRQGLDPNATSKRGVTPLMEACVSHLHDIVVELLSKGADPNRRDEDDKTALHLLCCAYRNTPRSKDSQVGSIGSALLSQDADPNACTKEGVTPLMKACGRPYHDLVVELLSNGADPNKRDQDGVTSLHYLCDGNGSRENSLIASTGSALLRHGADPNATIKRGVTPLMVACEKVYHDLVVELLSQGADPNERDQDGLTSLHYLLFYGNNRSREISLIASTGSALLKHGADPNATIKRGVTPLMKSCEKLYHDLVVELLSNGADPNKRDQDGLTSLHHLLCNDDGSREISLIASTGSALLKHGADPNATMKRGITPLMEACEKLNHDLVVELLSHGADPSRENDDGFTAFDRLFPTYKGYDQIDNLEIIRPIWLALIKSGANLTEGWRNHITNGNVIGMWQLVEMVIQAGQLSRSEVTGLVYLMEVIEDEGENEENDEGADRLKAYMKQFVETGFTLKEQCRLKLRQTIRLPLTTNVFSDDIVLPKPLRKYIIFE